MTKGYKIVQWVNSVHEVESYLYIDRVRRDHTRGYKLSTTRVTRYKKFISS